MQAGGQRFEPARLHGVGPGRRQGSLGGEGRVPAQKGVRTVVRWQEKEMLLFDRTNQNTETSQPERVEGETRGGVGRDGGNTERGPRSLG